METPKPKFNEKENMFKIKDKEKDISYTLSFSIESESLIINITEDSSIPLINYNAKFTLSDLVKQSRYFKLFESLEEFIPEIKSLFNDNKISMKKEKSEIILILSLPLKVVEEVFLCIPQGEVDSKQIINDLCLTVNELRNQIKLLSVNTISEEQLQKNLQSKDILLNEEEKKMVCDWILKQMKSEGKKIEMRLLYRLTTDGDAASTFHSKCNYQGYTLSLIRNTKGYRCGGFTSKNWTSCGNYVNDPNAFLFSLEYKEQYFTCDGINAIYDNGSYGPTFGNGNDLYIANNCTQNNSSYCNFPYSYGGVRARVLNGGFYTLKVNEIEVYKINII